MRGLVNFANEPYSAELRELPVPDIDEDDLLISVRAVGVCGSDLHQYTGTHSWPVNYPVVLGHEFSGVVAKIGHRVKGFKEGDGVVSDGYGIDLVIDATGVSASLKLALDIVRPAGQITKVGWGPQPFNHSLDPLVQKAVTLRGSFSHNWPVWENVLMLLASGRIDLDPILNRVAPLEEWHDIFGEMHSGKIVKGVLKP